MDCGCGAGEYVVALRDAGALAIGIEFDSEKRAQFAQRHPGADWVRAGDSQSLEFPDASFDAVLINEVLEHVPDDALALSEAHRVTKPGGRLILFAPNRMYPFETHGVYRLGSDRKLSPALPGIPYLPLRLGQRWFRYWARNYWPGELRRLVVAAGFAIESTGFVWQTFENISNAQPGFIGAVRPAARALANFCETIPGVRRFGVSQLIVAQR